jgi:tyrosinase
MSEPTRRSFLAAAACVPFSTWLEQQGLARPAQPLVRYEARTPKGRAMLQTYAKAVGKMKSTAEGDPRGWVFQWYTHWVAPKNPRLGQFDPRQKAEEIARIYPAASPWRDLAGEMWDTCQAHGEGMDENFFLPWHRLFVLYFEQIVRSVGGDDSFTLPYWNYSTSDTEVRGVLPPEFRKKDDPVFGPLYVEKRNPGVNNGQPIQKGRPGDPLNLDALAECLYEPVGAANGFCQALDFGLHGRVHVMVGNTQNMGVVPWAAGDPIFWLHHCNIDRLWASWNAGSRSNPDLDQTFIFADKDGMRVVANVSDVLDLGKLGYVYDRLEPVPPCPTPKDTIVTAAKAQKPVAAMKAASIKLGADPVKVTLEPVPPAEGEAAAPFAMRVKELPPGRRLFLVVKDLRAEQQPGVLYDLYLEIPEGVTGDKRKDYFIGTVNFFHAAGHMAHGEKPQPKKGPEKFLSFDVTELARKLLAMKVLTDKATLVIVPDGKPVDEAKAVIGEIRVVEQ